MSQPPHVELIGLSKTYAGVYALRDVSFAVHPGRVHALVGENGAGKSTLVKILAGALRADQGNILLDGKPIELRNARDAQRLGISLVHQELNLVPHLSVSENVFLGRWPRRCGFFVRSHDLSTASTKLLEELNLDVPVMAKVEHLTVAKQQMVEIAKALSIQSRLLILDEPSAVLTPPELKTLFGVIRNLTRRGASVIYISHRLEEIFALADDVTVLRDGCHISTRPIGETDRQQLIKEVVGRELSEEFPARTTKLGDSTLEVQSLCAPRRFRDVSFNLRAGEVLGLTGMVGSGRTSLAKAVFGAISNVQGKLRVGTKHGPFSSPREAQRAGIAFIPEDRRREGLLLLRSLRENITLAHLHEQANVGIIRPRKEKTVVGDLMNRLRIKARSSESAVATLSGGNQQKSMLARWMIKPYPVIILDEPTRGVDVGAKAEIYELMNSLAAQGAAILMISSELPEVIGMSDRIGVMCRGRLTGILDNSNRNVTQEQLLRLAVGESN